MEDYETIRRADFFRQTEHLGDFLSGLDVTCPPNICASVYDCQPDGKRRTKIDKI